MRNHLVIMLFDDHVNESEDHILYVRNKEDTENILGILDVPRFNLILHTARQEKSS
jgi:hypothetical protein